MLELVFAAVLHAAALASAPAPPSPSAPHGPSTPQGLGQEQVCRPEPVHLTLRDIGRLRAAGEPELRWLGSVEHRQRARSGEGSYPWDREEALERFGLPLSLDEEGSGTLLVPPGGALLLARAPGHHLLTEIPYRAQQRELRLARDRSLRVRLERTDGGPVSDLWVVLRPGPAPPAGTRPDRIVGPAGWTDAEGLVEFPHLQDRFPGLLDDPSERLHLLLPVVGGAPLTRELEPRDVGTLDVPTWTIDPPAFVELEYSPDPERPGHTLQSIGVSVVEGDEPTRDEATYLAPPGLQRRIPVQPGTRLHLRGRQQGVVGALEQQLLAPAQAGRSLRVSALDPGPTRPLRLQVLLDGDPLAPGARVLLRPRSRRQNVSWRVRGLLQASDFDADGIARIEVAEALLSLEDLTFDLEVTSSRQLRSKHELRLVRPLGLGELDLGALDLERPPVVLSGVVRDLTGRPVPLATLELQEDDPTEPRESFVQARTERIVTDLSGRFEVRSPSEARTFRLHPNHHGQWRRPTADLEHGQRDVVVLLDTGRALDLFVRLGPDVPAHRVLVRALQERDARGNFVSPTREVPLLAGRARLDGIPTGEVQLELRVLPQPDTRDWEALPFHVETLQVTASTPARVELDLPDALHWVHPEVVEAGSGAPIPNAKVGWSADSGDGRWSSGQPPTLALESPLLLPSEGVELLVAADGWLSRRASSEDPWTRVELRAAPAVTFTCSLAEGLELDPDWTIRLGLTRSHSSRDVAEQVLRAGLEPRLDVELTVGEPFLVRPAVRDTLRATLNLVRAGPTGPLRIGIPLDPKRVEVVLDEPAQEVRLEISKAGLQRASTLLERVRSSDALANAGPDARALEGPGTSLLLYAADGSPLARTPLALHWLEASENGAAVPARESNGSRLSLSAPLTLGETKTDALGRLPLSRMVLQVAELPPFLLIRTTADQRARIRSGRDGRPEALVPPLSAIVRTDTLLQTGSTYTNATGSTFALTEPIELRPLEPLVTGHIVDLDGAPVPDLELIPWALAEGSGTEAARPFRLALPAGPLCTDASGHFTIYGTEPWERLTLRLDGPDWDFPTPPSILRGTRDVSLSARALGRLEMPLPLPADWDSGWLDITLVPRDPQERPLPLAGRPQQLGWPLLHGETLVAQGLIPGLYDLSIRTSARVGWKGPGRDAYDPLRKERGPEAGGALLARVRDIQIDGGVTATLPPLSESELLDRFQTIALRFEPEAAAVDHGLFLRSLDDRPLSAWALVETDDGLRLVLPRGVEASLSLRTRVPALDAAGDASVPPAVTWVAAPVRIASGTTQVVLRPQPQTPIEIRLAPEVLALLGDAALDATFEPALAPARLPDGWIRVGEPGRDRSASVRLGQTTPVALLPGLSYRVHLGIPRDTPSETSAGARAPLSTRRVPVGTALSIGPVGARLDQIPEPAAALALELPVDLEALGKALARLED